VIVRLVGVLSHFNYLEDAQNHKPKKPETGLIMLYRFAVSLPLKKEQIMEDCMLPITV
jgi:hypothetical protein